MEDKKETIKEEKTEGVQVAGDHFVLEIDSDSRNEEFARVVTAVFLSRLNPTLEELDDVKTAVSEAVTNAVIHGYEGKVGTVRLEGQTEGNVFTIQVQDKGKGIANIKRAMEPMFTTDTTGERSGMGFSFMEAFMDQVQVESETGKGTTVTMKKEDRQVMDLDDVMAQIRKAHQGDKTARDQLVLDNMGLVWSIVRRFKGRGYELEDLFQIGSIGLLKAIDKFDLSYEVRFSTYAVPMIAGEIKRFLRDDGMIKVSRSIKEMGAKVKNARESLCGSLGREPTVEEIAGEIGATREEVAVSMEAAAEVESLYKNVGNGEDKSLCLMDKIEDHSERQEELINHMVLEKLIGQLGEKEREIIIRRYFQNQTQTQVAVSLGISQVQVSRLEKKILKQMREQF